MDIERAPKPADVPERVAQIRSIQMLVRDPGSGHMSRPVVYASILLALLGVVMLAMAVLIVLAPDLPIVEQALALLA